MQTAIKCNNSPLPVDVSGTSQWALVDPAGSSYVKSIGGSTRPPGCTNKHYSNPMSAEMIQRTQQLFNQGYPHVTWQIRGIEMPLQENGISEIWQTENFDVIP